MGTNADSLPTGTLYLNGTANGAPVTVTNVATGLYKAQVTLPTLAVNDEVEIVIAATVSSVSDSAVIWGDTKDVFAGAIPDVAAGGTNGLLIAGSNAATTFSGLTTGALACTTITASGAVAFQSTFVVTTSTSLAALSCTTLTASGAVAFQSTFAVTGTTTLTGNVSMGGTFGVTGTVTFNAFTCTNNFTVSGNWLTTGTTTWTGAAAFSAGLTSSITGTLSTVTTVTNQLTAATIAAAVRDVDNGSPAAGSLGEAARNADAKAADIQITLGAAGAGLTAIVLPSNGLANVTAWTVNITGTLSGTTGGMTAAGWAGAFLTNTTKTYSDAIAGSVVKETADNAGGASLTVQDIVDGVFDEAVGAHTGILATAVPAIKTKTDNLPADPADASDVAGALTALAAHGDSAWATATSVTVSDKNGFSLTADYDLAKTAAQAGDAMALTSDERDAVATVWLTFDLSGVSGEALHSPINAFRKVRQWNNTATPFVVYKEDGTTPAYNQTKTVTPTGLITGMIG